jgi:hypothetical protein
MKPVFKVSLSLLITIIVFSIFAVFAFSGLFDFIETRFYNQRIKEEINGEVVSSEKAIAEYHRHNKEVFRSVLNSEHVKRTFLPNQSREDIFGRENTFNNLQADFPDLLFVRIIDTDGNLHYSTYENDIRSRSDFNIVYNRLDESRTSVPVEKLSLTSEDEAGFIIDAEKNRIIYQFPFYDHLNIFKGTALFYMAKRSLKNELIKQAILEEGRSFSLVHELGYVFNVDVNRYAELQNEIKAAWQEKSEYTQVQNEPIISSETEKRFFLFSKYADEVGFIGYIVPENLFTLNQYLKIILMVAFFLTLFLILFLLLSIRQDKVLVLSERIKRFQINFLKEYVENKEAIDWEKWKRDVNRRKKAITAEIKNGLGALTEEKEKEVDELIDKSWDEILTIIGEREEEHEPEKVKISSNKVEIENLEQIIERVLKTSVATAQPAAAPGTGRESAAAQAAPPAQAPPTQERETPEQPPQEYWGKPVEVEEISEEGEEEMEELEEMEEAPEEAAEVPEEVEEAPSAEAPAPEEAPQEAPAPDEGELEELEEVEEVEEVEAPTTEAPTPEEPAQAPTTEEAAQAPSAAEKKEEEEIEEIQPVQYHTGEPIEVEEVEEEEGVPELEEVEGVEEIGEAREEVGEEQAYEEEEIEEVEEIPEETESEVPEAEPEPTEEEEEEPAIPESEEEEETREVEPEPQPEEEPPEEAEEEQEESVEEIPEAEPEPSEEEEEVEEVEELPDSEASLAEVSEEGYPVEELEELGGEEEEGAPLEEVEEAEEDIEEVEEAVEEVAEVEEIAVEELEPIPEEEKIKPLPIEKTEQAEELEAYEEPTSETEKAEAAEMVSGGYNDYSLFFGFSPTRIDDNINWKAGSFYDQEVSEVEELEEDKSSADEEGEGIEPLQPEEQTEEKPPRSQFDHVLQTLEKNGKIEIYGTNDIGNLVGEEENEAISSDEEGVPTIKEEVFGEGPPPQNKELQDLVENVEKKEKEDTEALSIGDLFSDEEVDLAFSEEEMFSTSSQKEEKYKERLAADAESITACFTNNGFNFDAIVKKYSHDQMGLMKALLSVSRETSAVYAAIMIPKDDVYTIDLSVGLDDVSISSFRINRNEDFYKEFLEKRKSVFLKTSLSVFKALANKMSQIDEKYANSFVFIPVVYDEQDAYLFLGLKSEDTSMKRLASDLYYLCRKYRY